MKQFSFRFDVDTHRCAETGVPSLLQLALDYRVPFTVHIGISNDFSLPEVAPDVLRASV